MAAKKFNPKLPFKTRGGYEVTVVVFDTKILGIVKYDNDTGIFVEWDKNGRKLNIYKRDKGDKHSLDLINIEE
jgi:hypothetical protein